jgi:predicted TIM-barrel fold metal-dependent hydrolase
MGDNSAIRHDYLPDDYRRDAAGHNVLATVHCEAEWERDDQLGETRWITQMHERHGLPGAIIAHAWFDTPNAEEIIAAQAANPLVRGIRSKPATASSPDKMTPGAPGTMQDEKWLRGFALLEKHGLSWDLRVPFWHLDEAAVVARAFPDTRIILNHTGFPWDRSEEGLSAWRRGMEVLARESNVWIKVSEFGLKDRAWDYAENRRIVLDAIAIFGIERAVFASNFPVASLRIGYDALVRAVSRILADGSADDRDRFFWKNAAAFYRLSL